MQKVGSREKLSSTLVVQSHSLDSLSVQDLAVNEFDRLDGNLGKHPDYVHTQIYARRRAVTHHEAISQSIKSCDQYPFSTGNMHIRKQGASFCKGIRNQDY